MQTHERDYYHRLPQQADDRLRVEKGPRKNLEAILWQWLSSPQRVRVLMEVPDRQTARCSNLKV